MKKQTDSLKDQLASLLSRPVEVKPVPVATAKAVDRSSRFIRASLVLFHQDDELVTQTIRAAADQGYRLNQSQAVRLLVRKAQGAPILATECEAVVKEDARRTRNKS